MARIVSGDHDKERSECNKVRNASALYGFGVVVTQSEMRQNGIGRGEFPYSPAL